MTPLQLWGRGKSRLEWLAVRRVEELEDVCARRPTVQYLHRATDPDRDSLVVREVIVKTGLSDLDVAVEHDEHGRATVGHRGGAPARFEREPFEPEAVGALRLGYWQLGPLDDPAQSAERGA